MTTQTIEEALTAEITEEPTQATQLSDESDSVQPESTTQAGAEAPLTADESLDTFFKDRGTETETEGDGAETEPEAKVTPPEVFQEAERIATERIAQQQQEAYQRGVEQAFANRTTNIRTYLTNVLTGKAELTSEAIEFVVQEFVAHNGQIAPVAAKQALQGAAGQWNSTLFSAVEKELPGATKGNFDSTQGFVKAVVAKARDGYVPAKEVSNKVKTEVSAYKKFLEDKGLLASAKAPPTESGGNALPLQDALTRALNEPLKDPNS